MSPSSCAGRKMFGVAQRGRILAMARQTGADCRGAQREALAQRAGERRFIAQDHVEQGEPGAGVESRVAARVGADGWLFRRPRPRRKCLFQRWVGRRGTRLRAPARPPPQQQGDRRLPGRVGGGSFTIEWVCRSESDHGFSITEGGALSPRLARNPPRSSPVNDVR
jgi:hypothetical protein